MLSAIAMIVSKLEFPLWFAPSFYKLDFSAVFALLGAFALGPVAGGSIGILKNALKLLIFGGTQTAYIGELADVLMLILLCVPAGIIYKKRKDIKGALIGMCVGVVCMTAGGCLFNYYVLIPFFAKLFEMSVDTIVDMGRGLNSSVDSLSKLIIFITAPFNLFKGVACSLITFLLYKRVSKILHI